MMSVPPNTNSMRDRIRGSLDSKALKRSEILARLREEHIVREEHDDLLDEEIESILTDFATGNATEGYALAVIGKSGAGKTALVNHRLDHTEGLQPQKDQYGNLIAGCLRVQTPPSCTVKSLGEEILANTGYKLTRNVREPDVWSLVKERLRAKQVFIVYLDEFQHALSAPTAKGRAHLTNTIKNLMQDTDWPIWLILSGVPDLLEFIERDVYKQMDRRARVLEIGALADEEKDIFLMEDVLKHLTSVCGLKLSIPLTQEFLRRMMHGGAWRFGMTIQLMKLALERALRDEKTERELRLLHFVEGYQRLSKCDDYTNVFKSDRWWEIIREVDNDGMLHSTTKAA